MNAVKWSEITSVPFFDEEGYTTVKLTKNEYHQILVGLRRMTKQKEQQRRPIEEKVAKQGRKRVDINVPEDIKPLRKNPPKKLTPEKQE